MSILSSEIALKKHTAAPSTPLVEIITIALSEPSLKSSKIMNKDVLRL